MAGPGAVRLREPPAALNERPELLPHLVWVWQAFWRLSTERPQGFAVGPIPQHCFYDCCVRHGITGYEEQEDLVDLFSFCDREYLAWLREQEDAKKTAPKQ